MKVLDLCCGNFGWSKPFIDAGHEVTGVDLEKKDIPDSVTFIQADIFDWEPNQHYDIILASPKCSEFSEIKRNCAHPYDERIGLDMVYRVMYLIMKIKPKYWVLENVKGLSEFIDKPRDTVRYGKRTRKTAYLWGNFPELGFFNEQIEFNSHMWHDEPGWNMDVRARRGEIPQALARKMFQVMTHV